MLQKKSYLLLTSSFDLERDGELNWNATTTTSLTFIDECRPADAGATRSCVVVVPALGDASELSFL